MQDVSADMAALRDVVVSALSCNIHGFDALRRYPV